MTRLFSRFLDWLAPNPLQEVEDRYPQAPVIEPRPAPSALLQLQPAE